MEGSSFAALVLLLVPALQQSRREQALDDFKEFRTKVLVKNGQRHLEYGLELRDKGLTTQAGAQIILSVALSRERNPAATMVLGLMRQYGDAFWKRRPSELTPAKLATYEKKAQKLRLQDQEDLLEVVRYGEKLHLDEQAYSELSDLLVAIDEPLEFDERGALVLPGGKLDGPLAERAHKDAIAINGKAYARDVFLQRLPQVSRIYEASSPELRVRTTTNAAEAEHLHAAAVAVLPALGAALGATPDRRLQIVVLAERASYGAYLDFAGLSSHRAADGFADRVAATAVLCHEGLTDESVLGLALHELTHLYQLSVTPAALPSWFLEGSAEAFGGEGTFHWDGTTLETGGKMAAKRLDELRASPLALRELLGGEALTYLKADKAAARRFYAESWAFLRFLQQGAGEEIAERLERWRAMCLGSAIGADLDKPYAADAAKSRALFLELFDKDLDALETAFTAWLAAL